MLAAILDPTKVLFFPTSHLIRPVAQENSAFVQMALSKSNISTTTNSHRDHSVRLSSVLPARGQIPKHHSIDSARATRDCDATEGHPSAYDQRARRTYHVTRSQKHTMWRFCVADFILLMIHNPQCRRPTRQCVGIETQCTRSGKISPQPRNPSYRPPQLLLCPHALLAQTNLRIGLGQTQRENLLQRTVQVSNFLNINLDSCYSTTHDQMLLSFSRNCTTIFSERKRHSMVLESCFNTMIYSP